MYVYVCRMACLITLQCWVRYTLANRKADIKRAQRDKERSFAFKKAQKIQKMYRGRLGRREYRRYKHINRCAAKIQAIIRGRLAKRGVLILRLQHKAATKIQGMVRVRIAKSVFQKKLIEFKKLQWIKSIIVQQWVRRYLAQIYVHGMLARQTPREKVPVSSWIHTYGCDSRFGTRRNTRIITRAFYRIISHPKHKVWTKYGYTNPHRFPVDNLYPYSTTAAYNSIVELDHRLKRDKYASIMCEAPVKKAAKAKQGKEEKGNLLPRNTQVYIFTRDKYLPICTNAYLIRVCIIMGIYANMAVFI